MRHLIITGPQASGKTLLAQFIEQHFVHEDSIHDECAKYDILTFPLDEVSQTQVFVTNEEITYADVDFNQFLIIKLCSIMPAGNADAKAYAATITRQDILHRTEFMASLEDDHRYFENCLKEAAARYGKFEQFHDGGDWIAYQNEHFILISDCGVNTLYRKLPSI